MTSGAYDPEAVELRRQQLWRERGVHRVDESRPGRAVCVYVPAPFTSGRLHIGHVRSHAIADAYARFKRARGDDVLFSIGFDAFGLPAELEAVRRDLPIGQWVAECSRAMRTQMDRLGFSIAWEREFATADDTIYRWSQRLFHMLHEAGLVYRANASVDWCDSCSTVIAQVQAEDGACWRCGTPLRVVERPQWYVKVSSYVAENEERLDKWGEQDQLFVASQREVIGRIAGVELEAEGADGRVLSVFTQYAARAGESRFVAISPRHPEIHEWAPAAVVAGLLEELRGDGWRRGERDAERVPLAPTGHELRLPGLEERLPLVISPLVDARYGATAVLGIPAVERGDALVAARMGVAPPAPADDDVAPTSPAASAAARPATRHRAGDVAISRQRCWGAPIPIVYCEACGTVPVPVADQPVLLPPNLQSTAAGSSLADHAEFVETACPRCGGFARRETDTIDCHFDAMWLWIPSCVPAESRADAMFDHAELQRWLPAAMVVWGADGGRYMFDQRMTAKALRDLGALPWLEDGEPFRHVLMHEMVRTDGRKMSKHLGNSVDPAEIVEEVGADALRLAVLVSAAPRKPLAWSAENLRRSCDFLRELWEYAEPRLRRADEAPDASAEIAIDATDPLRLRLARWCDAATRRVTEDVERMELHKATDNVLQLFKRIRQFELRVAGRRQLREQDEQAIVAALLVLVRLLAPFAPHVSEELWELSGRGALDWPSTRERERVA